MFSRINEKEEFIEIIALENEYSVQIVETPMSMKYLTISIMFDW